LDFALAFFDGLEDSGIEGGTSGAGIRRRRRQNEQFQLRRLPVKRFARSALYQ
jgi:hypothetical protein